ncbi:hypothetical protein K2173_002770 [Erythroxylum novogranatense]|uniref:C2H2-type domain-containing protein n=1 Tax=Erythroxylum novogranatense TaxID=1862640 RepID=A0AAV8SQY3_9ROSI|nr:hypothetical protein K2173_002770 [Erythroxylum novogranatense]
MKCSFTSTMAAELGLLSLNQLQKLAQSQQNQHQHHQTSAAMPSGVWMWSPTQTQEDDESWEVRAFAEDTGNVMGTTWPPRSYTCTFCRREFRSAQALGGHMNVHRRDRARLHQSQVPSSVNPNSSSTSTSASPFTIPTQEFYTSAGLSLLCQFPYNQGRVMPSANMNARALDSPSTLLSMSQYPRPIMVGQSLNFSAQPQMATNSCHLYYNKAETSASVDYSSNLTGINNCNELGNHEELDLELRLGHSRPTTSSSS